MKPLPCALQYYSEGVLVLYLVLNLRHNFGWDFVNIVYFQTNLHLVSNY